MEDRDRVPQRRPSREKGSVPSYRLTSSTGPADDSKGPAQLHPHYIYSATGQDHDITPSKRLSTGEREGWNVALQYASPSTNVESNQDPDYFTTKSHIQTSGSSHGTSQPLLTPASPGNTLSKQQSKSHTSVHEMEARQAEFRRNANWKPFGMRTVYLTTLALIACAIIGGIEVLIRMSRRLQPSGIPRGVVRYMYADLRDVSIWRYFAWNYLPILIQVVYGILWEAADSHVKRMEPYYQLSSEANSIKGASGGGTLTINYFEFWVILTPFQALGLRHWAVACSSLASVLAFFVAPLLQSGLFSVKRFRQAREDYVVIVEPVFARILQGTLGVILIANIILTVLLWRRKSGLLHDPANIASVASIASESDSFLSEFRSVLTERSKDLMRRFESQRYRLILAEREDDGRLVYRIENTGKGVFSHKPNLKDRRLFNKDSKFDGFRRRLKRFFTPPDGHPPMLHFLGIVPFVLALAFKLMFFVSLYLWLNQVKGFSGFHRVLGYFSARTVSIIFTGVSVIFKSIWVLVDRNVRTMQPYIILHKQHATARRSLLLDYTATIPIWVTIKATINGDALLAMTTFMTLLVEVYTVTVGNCVNFALALFQQNFVDEEERNLDDQAVSKATGYWSFYLTLSILTGMIIMSIVVYVARRKPFLPREMGNIAAIVSVLYASSILDLFRDTSKSRNITESPATFEAMRHGRYGFGWFLAVEPTTNEGEKESSWCLGIEDSRNIFASDYRFGDVKIDQAQDRQQRQSQSNWFGHHKGNDHHREEEGMLNMNTFARVQGQAPTTIT